MARTAQGVFLTVAQVRPGQSDELMDDLRGIGSAAEIASGVRVPQDAPPEALRVRFEDLTTTHYVRWVILPESADAEGRAIPAQLLLSTCYDEPFDEHLEEFVRVCWPTIAEVYRHCEGYTAGGTRDGLVAFLRAGARGVSSPAVFYGSPGRTLTAIRQEAALRDTLEGVLDSRTWAGCGSLEVRGALQESVLANPELHWALAPPPGSSRGSKVRHFAPLAAILAGVLAAWPGLPIVAAIQGRRLGISRGAAIILGMLLAAGPLAAWLARLRYHEERDPETDQLVPDHHHLVAVEVEEDWGQQNQFTKLVNVKPGPFRQYTLRVFLLATGLGCRFIFTKGQLLGIRSIHFANWSFLDGGRRMIFMSNFDGSWENYLSEFIDGSGRGLTAIYSQTALFPRSRWLFWGGTQDEQRYKTLVRNAQLVTEVWYRAYDGLSVENVNNNSEIRAGLWKPMDEREAQAWLNRL